MWLTDYPESFFLIITDNKSEHLRDREINLEKLINYCTTELIRNFEVEKANTTRILGNPQEKQKSTAKA